MKDEEINIAIAEVCGWKRPDSPDAMKLKQEWTMPEKWWLCPKGVLSFKHDIPDYCNDLNAMHKAEKMVTNAQKKSYVIKLNQAHETADIFYPSQDQYGFKDDLAQEVFNLIHATARQRAEAFLKTLNLWKEAQQ